jgi:hypothetical protein
VISGRRYHVKAYFPFSGTVAADTYLIRLREGTTTGGAQITYATGVVQALSSVFVETPESDWVASTTGSQSFCVTVQRNIGSGTATPKGATSQTRFLIVDLIDT